MKRFVNVYAVFAVGFIRGEMRTYSYQCSYDSKEIAEAVGMKRWLDAHPDAKQNPIVEVYGPYVIER